MQHVKGIMLWYCRVYHGLIWNHSNTLFYDVMVGYYGEVLYYHTSYVKITITFLLD